MSKLKIVTKKLQAKNIESRNVNLEAKKGLNPRHRVNPLTGEKGSLKTSSKLSNKSK